MWTAAALKPVALVPVSVRREEERGELGNRISMVFVDPDRWGEGIAKRLMRHLFAQAQERGYERYQLWTQAENHRAQALYEGLGFGPSGREKDDDLGERTVHYELPPRLWDESLYAGSAEYYAVGRLPYPQRLAGAIRGHLALDGRGRLLDLGCGPGSLTLLLAPLFDRVVAVDADADMLEAGRRRAAAAHIDNVDWLHLRAEQLHDDLGSFDVVTLAQSFHWMDQALVAAKIRAALSEGGCCVHVGATTHEGVAGAEDLPHPAPPREKIAALVRDYLGPHRRAGRRVVTEEMPSHEDDAFRAAGLVGPERFASPQHTGDAVAVERGGPSSR